jgi:hypothetical protein
MKKKLLTLFVIMTASSFGLEVKALVHFTECTMRPSQNTGLCTPKQLAGHGNECISGGNCLTNPTFWQGIFGVKQCDCNGTTSGND